MTTSKEVSLTLISPGCKQRIVTKTLPREKGSAIEDQQNAAYQKQDPQCLPGAVPLAENKGRNEEGEDQLDHSEGAHIGHLLDRHGGKPAGRTQEIGKASCRERVRT